MSAKSHVSHLIEKILVDPSFGERLAAAPAADRREILVAAGIDANFTEEDVNAEMSRLKSAAGQLVGVEAAVQSDASTRWVSRLAGLHHTAAGGWAPA